MKIDWFVFVAQIINFLVLVWLLRRFLYRPVIAVMRERKDRVRARLDDAKAKGEEADRLKIDFENRIQNLEREKERYLDEARREATDLKEDLTRIAREDVESSRKSWEASIAAERESFQREFRRRSGEQVYAVVRRILRDMAEEELEERAIDVFAKRLRKLDSEKKSEIASSLRSKGEITVTTAFEASPERKEILSRIVRDEIAVDAEVRFETDPSLLCGVTLTGGGYEVSWSLAGYMDGIEEDLLRLLGKGGIEDGESRVASSAS